MGSYPRDTLDDAVAVPETRAERRDRATADTRASILAAARERLLAVGYANLSTRTVADAAGVPLSQIHYHFGSKQQLILDVLEAENERLLARQRSMYAGPEPLWRQWELACDYLDEDIESGYVRILQEMIAAGWSDAEVAAAVREYQLGWYRLLTQVAERESKRLGGLGPFEPREVAALMGLPFIGAESLILLGMPESVLPARAALRKLGEFIRSLEEDGSAAAERGCDDDHASDRPAGDYRRCGAIKATIDDYYLGWYDADGDRMARALTRCWQSAGGGTGATEPSRSISTPSTRWSALPPPGEGRQTDAAVRAYDISVHDVHGDIAAATVHAVPYVDYLRADPDKRRLAHRRTHSGARAEAWRVTVGRAEPGRDGSERTRADEGALPRRDRLHRARRRSRVLGALRRRQPDDPPDADVVDLPLAPLEACRSPTSRATSGSSRSTAAATGAPTARPISPPTPTRSSSPTPPRLRTSWPTPGPRR